MMCPLQVPLTEFSQRRPTPRVPFIHFLKCLVNGPPSRFPHGAPMERDSRLHSFFYINFRVLRKGSPPPGSSDRAPIERTALFPVPNFICLSEFLVNRTPLPCVPTGPLWTEVTISTPFYT